jgi:hypothetical protein
MTYAAPRISIWGRHVYYPDWELFDSAESESLLHWPASKILKEAPVEWRERGRLKNYLRRYHFTRRFKGHDYGMVGFVKQLIDELGVSEWTGPMGVARLSNRRRRKGSPGSATFSILRAS